MCLAFTHRSQGRVPTAAAIRLFLLARESKEGENTKKATAFLQVLPQDFCAVSLVLPEREEPGNYNLGADHVDAQDNKNRKRKEERLLGYLY